MYAGDPMPTPADRAMARVVVRHGLPRELPEALLDGFEWDARGRRYETIEDLYDYGARVAGTVGAMMAVLMGRTSAEFLISRIADPAAPPRRLLLTPALVVRGTTAPARA